MESIDLVNGNENDVVVSASVFTVEFGPGLPSMTYGKLKNGFTREAVFHMVNKTAIRIYEERNLTPPGNVVRLDISPTHYTAVFRTVS